MKKFVLWTNWVLAILGVSLAYAESRGTSDYKGISDPFHDPSIYEFNEDENEDKEFFHLGRYLMVGIDGGVGAFTGGVGSTAEPGPYAGLKIVYFFDRWIAFEFSAHYAQHNEVLMGSSAALANIDNTLIPISLGFRYYFDTANVPRAVALASPYVVLAPGIYLNQETLPPGSPLESGASANFGSAFGGGAEFLIYRHLYMGIDLRYHLVVFLGETIYQIQGVSIDRSGDYLSSSLTFTYDF